MREMKDSGVVWIGEIPEKWETVRFKDHYKNKKEIAGEHSSEFERLALTLNGVIKRPKDDSEGLQPKEFDTYQILRENDFVFKMIDLQNISTSRVGLSPYTGLVSPAYIRFTSRKENQFNKFTYYFLMSMYYNCVFNNLGGDGVRSALNASDMGTLMIPNPNLATQQKIAAHLDRKCTQIDALISNAQQQIEKLKAYKQSVITETVTKGLDPDVAMKDSGVEWIGEIPENWEVIRLKNLATIVRGGSPRPAGDERFYVGSIPFMKIADITKDENKYVYDCVSSIKEAGLVHTRMVEPETLLLTNSGATLGVPKITMFRTTFNDGIAAFLNLDKKIDILYAFYSLKARTKLFLESASMGMGQPNLNTEIIGNTLITLPSIEEQNEIVAYLDEKCSQIDKLIALKQQKIEKLQQYKKSLIYEYVTGKKEV